MIEFYIFSFFSEEYLWAINGTALSLYFAFGTVDIFTRRILLIHEHGRAFHLLVSSICFLIFFLKKSLLVKFILRFFSTEQL